MPRVLEIKPAKRGGRMLVKFDGGDMLRLSKEILIESGLAVGDELSQGEFAVLKDKTGTPADAAAAEYLARRPYSCLEIAEKLVERGYTEAEITAGTNKLKEMGILDDFEYARTLSVFCSGKRMSLRAFKEELYKRKVDREASEAALSDYPAPDDAIDMLIRQKLGSKPPTRESLTKVANYLRAKGFNYSDIKNGLRKISEEIVNEEGE